MEPGLTQTANPDATDAPELIRAPVLVVGMECNRPLAMSARASLLGVDGVAVGRGARRALEYAGADELNVRVPDPSMSARHARMTREGDRWRIEDEGSKNGLFVNGSQVERCELGDGDIIRVGHTLLLFLADAPIRAQAPPAVDAAKLMPLAPGLLTLDDELSQLYGELARVARSAISVLQVAESGSGKELVARAIHQLSGRSGAFVAVNCGAIPETLAESELFGAERGAFSGATHARNGLIREADGGTLFLDEIGDLPLPSQAALLRVLQEREVRPVGATQAVSVDVRVVAATHRDLDSMAAGGEFREDLLSRLCGFRAAIPPLRERIIDLGNLIAALLLRVAAERADRVRFDCDAAVSMYRYHWPNNVRELEQALAAASVLAEDRPISRSHLPESLTAVAGMSGAVQAPIDPVSLPGDPEGRRAALVRLLHVHDGNISAVARATGKARSQIQRWVRSYDIDLDELRG